MFQQLIHWHFLYRIELVPEVTIYLNLLLQYTLFKLYYVRIHTITRYY